MPRLTEYLLKLATHTRELDDFRERRDEGPQALHDYLVASPGPGLSDEQAEALASRDARRIQDAVHAECAAELEGELATSVTLTIYAGSTRIQTDLF